MNCQFYATVPSCMHCMMIFWGCFCIIPVAKQPPVIQLHLQCITHIGIHIHMHMITYNIHTQTHLVSQKLSLMHIHTRMPTLTQSCRHMDTLEHKHTHTHQLQFTGSEGRRNHASSLFPIITFCKRKHWVHFAVYLVLNG